MKKSLKVFFVKITSNPVGIYIFTASHSLQGKMGSVYN
jgi:hypothetical protein